MNCFLSATQETQLLVVGHKLEVLCYASKDLSLAYGISKLVIPALVDQLHSMRKVSIPDLLKRHPEVSTLCHFSNLLGAPALKYLLLFINLMLRLLGMLAGLVHHILCLVLPVTY